ncbi:nickel insertion protein [Alkalibacillus aidingensis]|uniref:nickel insertion protein n=1 Tax=Alkalibacillus aidingensis TaxID=2747607 RepID=UPI001660B688|nr:nickel insertion protein [Alkalibacillus aidingensis]
MSFNHREEHIDNGMMKLEVNLDDTPGEWLGYLMDLLFDKGANDVYYTPIYMKKNRPAVKVEVLYDQKVHEDITDIIFKETTTLGVRFYPLSVHRLERKFQKIMTKWGEVTVKKGLKNGEVVKSSPEFDECKAIAQKHQVPLKTVYQEVMRAVNDK